jgi:hypothetical protein
MPHDLQPLDPRRFNLKSFADILPARHPIVGEEAGSFASFHEALTQALAPMTAYECVIAENLILIEWDMLQHRRMHDASIRQMIRDTLRKAVAWRQQVLHEQSLAEAYADFIEAGGTEDQWHTPSRFDSDAAGAMGDDLARRAASSDPTTHGVACDEIAELGLEPVLLMAEAYHSRRMSVLHHEHKLQELEKRRREVKRDFDQLQKTRPVEGQVKEPVVEAEITR